LKAKRGTVRKTGAFDLALAFLGAANATDVQLARVVDVHIARVMEAADGNLSLAASLLGVNRRTLQRYKERQNRRRRRRRSSPAR
jgi:ActR/RegA family two-component response regulator